MSSFIMWYEFFVVVILDFNYVYMFVFFLLTFNVSLVYYLIDLWQVKKVTNSKKNNHILFKSNINRVQKLN